MVKSRILNAEKYLRGFLKDGEAFHIGLLFEDFLKSSNNSKYNLPKQFVEGANIVPSPIGSNTKANVKGKYIRKQPEEKNIIKRHIKYIRKKDKIKVEFDRDFNVYVKELLNQYNIGFTYRTNIHGQKLVTSPTLVFENTSDSEMKSKHVINMFCEVFNDFEVLDKDLQPAIHFNKRFDNDLLPMGMLSDTKTYEALMEFSAKYTRNQVEQGAFQKRLNVLMNYKPEIKGKGPNGFFGYILFGFDDLGIAILETMYSDNATYIFRTKNYDEAVITDKQTVIKNKLAKRLFHYDNWEANIHALLSGEKKS